MCTVLAFHLGVSLCVVRTRLWERRGSLKAHHPWALSRLEQTFPQAQAENKRQNLKLQRLQAYTEGLVPLSPRIGQSSELRPGPSQPQPLVHKNPIHYPARPSSNTYHWLAALRLTHPGAHPSERSAYMPSPSQVERIVSRDGLSEKEARARIAAQMPTERKKALASLLIDNRSTEVALRQQVRARSWKGGGM